MTIFSEALTKAIGDYRTLLRRHLDQADRVKKLRSLQIRGTFDAENEPELFKIGHNIVNDIERHLGRALEGNSYYAYSGVQKFCECLKEFLEQYCIHRGAVVHTAQQAARSVLLGVQLVGLPPSQLSGEVLHRLRTCSEDVLAFGSHDQKKNFSRLLAIGKERTPDVFTTLSMQFDQQFATHPVPKTLEDDEDWAVA